MPCIMSACSHHPPGGSCKVPVGLAEESLAKGHGFTTRQPAKMPAVGQIAGDSRAGDALQSLGPRNAGGAGRAPSQAVCGPSRHQVIGQLGKQVDRVMAGKVPCVLRFTTRLKSVVSSCCYDARAGQLAILWKFRNRNSAQLHSALLATNQTDCRLH